MSDGEAAEFDTEYDSEFFDGSEGDQDQIAHELDDQDDESSDDESNKSDEEEDLPNFDAAEVEPGPSSAHQSKVVDEVPGISSLALIALQAAYPAWKAEKGNKRKQVWRDLLKQLRTLPGNNTLLQSQWDLRGELYLRWIRRQGRKLPKRAGFFSTPKWTVRRVVTQLKEKQINETLQNVYGATPGSKAMLEHYQKALSQVIEELSPADLEEMQRTALEWNTTTEPDSAKARFATRGMGTVVKKFAEEMWKRGGIRMLVLTGYKDEQNAWITSNFDFNSEIGNGETFRHLKSFQGPWDRYIQRSFKINDDSEDPSEDSEDHKATTRTKSKKLQNNLSGEDALKLITRADGGIWIPELLGRNRSDVQALVRAFLTAHYRKTCGNPKTSAPFRKLALFQDQLVLAKHIPEDFIFPGDPSHMITSEAMKFLEFIRDRQTTSPQDVFAFQYRFGRDSQLEDPVPNSDHTDDDERLPRLKKKISRRKNASEKDRPPKQAIVTDAEDTDDQNARSQGAKASKGGLRVYGSRRPQLGAPGTSKHRPRGEDDAPRDVDEDSTGEESEIRRKLAKGKGKAIVRPNAAKEIPPFRRPNAAEEILPLKRNNPLPVVNNRTEDRANSDEGTELTNVDRRQKAVKKPEKSSKTVGAPITNKSLPGNASEHSATLGTTRKQAAQSQEDHPLPSNTSATSSKVGPPIGVKRAKQVKKGTSLPRQNSAPNKQLQTASTPAETPAAASDEDRSHRAHREVPIVIGTAPRPRNVSAGHTGIALRPATLKSALKGSSSANTNRTEAQQPQTADGTTRSIQQATRAVNDRRSRSSTPTPKVPTHDETNDQLEALTPRRSGRERRAPSRVDDEEPNRKRQPPSAPLTSNFKAKRARFN